MRLIGKAATAIKRLSEETLDSYSSLKEAVKKRFEPESKRELYMAEFQARQKTKAEDWASFVDDLHLLAEKAYPGLQAEAQETLALNRFLTQLEHPQINFAVRQKQPANIDQAVQYTLEAESYLNPHKQKVETTIAPVSHSQTDFDPSDELVAATSSRNNPLAVIMNQLDEIECQLNSLSLAKKSEHSSKRNPNRTTQSGIQPRAPVVCFKCGQEDHFARGYAVRIKKETANQGNKQESQPLNVISQTVNKNDITAGDTIPAVSTDDVTTDHSLQGTIKGRPAKFLVDTGAAVSILSKHVWDVVSKQQENTLEEATGKSLIGVEGSPLKIMGAVYLEVTFEKQQFDVCFLVADSLTTEAILGQDFLKSNKCIIDVAKSVITFGDTSFTLKLNCATGDS